MSASQHISALSSGAANIASLGSTRPAADIPAKISEQKRWVEQFTKSLPSHSGSKF